MTTASAVELDSLWADSIIVYNGVDNPELAQWLVDEKYADLDNGALLDLGFYNESKTGLRTIKKNATLNIYCKKDPTVDSSAGELILFKTDAEGVILYQSEPYLLVDGLNTITTPDNEYTYVEFQLAGLGNPNGAKGFLIDAVQLIQEEDKVSVPRSSEMRNSRIISNYPNPFLSGDANSTTLRFALAHEAEVGVVVIDALGRITSQLNLGIRTEGIHETSLSVLQPGMYIIRLVIDGEISGEYFKVVAK